MNKSIAIAAAAAILAGVMPMQAADSSDPEVSGFPIGYCDGSYNPQSLVKHDEADCWISAAIYIPQEYAATVAGNELKFIKVAASSKLYCDSLRVWIRTQLDDENLAFGTASSIQRGWNEVALETPYTIAPDTEGFYIGYSYYQKRISGLISVFPTPHENALFAQLGTNAEWQDASNEGLLCVEGLLYGGDLPQLDAQLLEVLTPSHYSTSSGKLDFNLRVVNRGVKPITSIEVATQLEGDARGRVTTTLPCNLTYGVSTTLPVTLRPDVTVDPDQRNRSLQVEITKVNGEADDNPADNVGSGSLSVIERGFPRRVLLEEFTTERCPNCPSGAALIHAVLSEQKYIDRVEMLCHHAGYYTDWLTTSFAEDYLWFFSPAGGSFAPAVMLNRTSTDGLMPPFALQSQQALARLLDSHIAQEALIEVVPTCSYADGKANVEVTVRRAFDQYLPAGARLTVFLVEDNIAAISQAGAGAYTHRHVGRAVNSSWGEPVEWNGDTFTYTHEFTVGEAWKTDNLTVLAVVTRFNPSDPNGCTVENLAGCTLDGQASVDTLPVSPEATETARYTIDGRRLAAPVPGINIVVYSDGTTRKELVR